MPARLLLLCLLPRSSSVTVEDGRHVGAAGVLHRRGGRAAATLRVGVAGGVPDQERRERRRRACSCGRAAVRGLPGRTDSGRPIKQAGRAVPLAPEHP
jgi:hypothetical protein